MSRLILPLLGLFALCCPRAAAEAVELTSPSGTLRCALADDEGRLTYEVWRDTMPVVERSPLFVKLIDGPKLGSDDTRIIAARTRLVNDDLTSPLYETASVRDLHAATELRLQTGERRFRLLINMYDVGLAWRWEVPDDVAAGLEYEGTQLRLGRAEFWWEAGPEDGYKKASYTSQFNTLTPLLARVPAGYVAIGEADNDGRASRLRLEVARGTVGLGQRVGRQAGGAISPWRYILIGARAIDLPAAKWVVRALCPPPKGDFSWVEPGTCIRHLQEGNEHFTTDSVLRTIDFATRGHFRYVLLDAGWYGLGYHEEGNPRCDPTKPVKTLDVAQVIDYARNCGVGIFLYVNRIAWEAYNPQTTLDTYARWGAAGVKMGFVDGSSREGMALVYNVVRLAASRRLLVNVHDSMRPTGCERTWPNLLTVEGVRGNEHLDNSTAHTTTLPFSRSLAGPTDYTICYPGDHPDGPLARLKATRAHQIALATILFSPLQHLLWYGRWWQYATPLPAALTELPTVWDETRWLDGAPGQWVCVARRSGRQWWVAAACNESGRHVSVPLPFAGDQAWWVERWADDGAGGLARDEWSGHLGGALTATLGPGAGVLWRLTPADKTPAPR